ncbi:hypothetical protein AArcSl_2562 [Halalkaliarchaeum desulfuricum]|uniref:Uncharacterized protein n=1 Tax=Halalkaliarchaeum desulfuricum TaxID=2055893 RepID=A0A343TM60_9EURY|nr:hypothetical protein [Halalkaliarchaeum desulfuricum]AUX10182.1 hypothetical protein AArcSl_2562 [Halalkaliarchaeum desulfuricum]
MTTHSDDGSKLDRSPSPLAELSAWADDTVEAYEDDGNVVFYDAENPLAWVETTRALDLGNCA